MTVSQSFLIAVCIALSAPALAQHSGASMIVGAAQPLMLKSGTPIRLRTLGELTTKGKHLKIGDRFNLEVADSVTLAEHVIIPVGSSAVGEITSIRNKGMWGKSGNIETRLISLTANGRTIRIAGSINDKGVKSGGGAIATSAIVFLPAGFFMTGTSAVIPSGTLVQGMIAEDVPVMLASQATQQAMTVPASAILAPTSPAPVVQAAEPNLVKP